MRVAVCDDDKRDCEKFLAVFQSVRPDVCVEEYFSGTAFLHAADKAPIFDIVYLDIYMPWDNGVDVAQKLIDISPQTAVVFVTTSTEHAVEAFSVHALHYLVKPITGGDIRESLRRLDEWKESHRRRNTLDVYVGRDSYSIYMDEIFYIHSANHATEIVTADGKNYRVWLTLSEVSEQLDESFLKIQRGMIVNMNYIEQMGIDSCILRDGTKLLLSRSERQEIRQIYDNYAFSHLSDKRRGYNGGE